MPPAARMISLAPLFGSLSVSFADTVAEEVLIREQPGDTNKVNRETQLSMLRIGVEAGSLITAYVDKSQERWSAGRVAEGAFYANNALLAKTLKFWIGDVGIKKT